MRRIVTRLIIANLIPLALKAGKKALRNRKSASVKTADQSARPDKSSHDEFIDKGDAANSPQRDAIDKGLS